MKYEIICNGIVQASTTKKNVALVILANMVKSGRIDSQLVETIAESYVAVKALSDEKQDQLDDAMDPSDEQIYGRTFSV